MRKKFFKKDNENKSFLKSFFSFTFTFIFIFLFLVNFARADISSSSLVQTSNDISSSFSSYSTCVNKQGSGGIQFDSTGTYVYMTPCLPDSSGTASNNNDYIIQFQTGTPYDIGTLTFVQRKNINITGLDLYSFYLAPDGINLYGAYHNESFSIRHIRHWTLSTAWNISTAIQQTTEEYRDSSGASQEPTNVFITSDGTKLIYSGFITTGNSFKVTNLSIAFNLSGTQTLSYSGTTPSGVGYSNKSRGVSFTSTGTTMFISTECRSSTDRTYGIKQYSFNNSIPYDVSKLNFTAFLDLGTDDGLCNGRGNVNIYQWNDGYTNYFIDTASTIGGTFVYKYSFSSLASDPVVSNDTTNTGYQDTIVDPVLRFFPDKDSLSFKQKMGFVFITMILIALVLGFATGSLSEGMPKIVVYLIFILEIGAFLFFVSIGYIGVSVLILMALVSIAVILFRFKSGGTS